MDPGAAEVSAIRNEDQIYFVKRRKQGSLLFTGTNIYSIQTDRGKTDAEMANW